MELISKRFSKGKNSSVAELSIDGKIFCFIIENLNTIIAPGNYYLTIQNEITPLTKRHLNSEAYKGWFKRHIEISGVKNRSGLYIHIGNYWQDSEGCNLPCFRVQKQLGEQVGIDSTPATKQLYAILYPLLENGEKITFKIIEDYEKLS